MYLSSETLHRGRRFRAKLRFISKESQQEEFAPRILIRPCRTSTGWLAIKLTIQPRESQLWVFLTEKKFIEFNLPISLPREARVLNTATTQWVDCTR